MFEELKEMERALMVLYDRLQDPFPGLHCLSFSVLQTQSKKSSYVYGFIHIGGKSHMFDHISDLIILRAKIEKNQILYQGFDGLRMALK